MSSVFSGEAPLDLLLLVSELVHSLEKTNTGVLLHSGKVLRVVGNLKPSDMSLILLLTGLNFRLDRRHLDSLIKRHIVVEIEELNETIGITDDQAFTIRSVLHAGWVHLWPLVLNIERLLGLVVPQHEE